jgi:translation elongation factor EF-4
MRVVDGRRQKSEKLLFIQTEIISQAGEVRVRAPVPTAIDSLGPGEVGY